MFNSISSIQSLVNHSGSVYVEPYVAPSITFTSGSVASGTYQGSNFMKFANAGDYAFNISGYKGKTLNFAICGGGSGGQHGFISSQRGGSGGSGGQVIYGSYVIQTNNFNCTARVGLGGIGSYYGNGGRGTNGTNPITTGDTLGTLYGTTTTNDPEQSVSAGQIKCSGGYTQLVAPTEWGTIKALGGLAGDPNTYQTINSCPSTGYSLGTNTTATFAQGKTGGVGNFGTSQGGNGENGPLVYFINSTIPLYLGSSAGGSGSDQYAQSTTGGNAGKASGSSGSYTGHLNPNTYDGFPASDTFGGGGGGASGSGGVPYNSSGANYARQKGGNGSIGTILLWWV